MYMSETQSRKTQLEKVYNIQSAVGSQGSLSPHRHDFDQRGLSGVWLAATACFLTLPRGRSSLLFFRSNWFWINFRRVNSTGLSGRAVAAEKSEGLQLHKKCQQLQSAAVDVRLALRIWACGLSISALQLMSIIHITIRISDGESDRSQNLPHS